MTRQVLEVESYSWCCSAVNIMNFAKVKVHREVSDVKEKLKVKSFSLEKLKNQVHGNTGEVNGQDRVT